MSDLKEEKYNEKPEATEPINPKYAEIREAVLTAIEQEAKAKEQNGKKVKKVGVEKDMKVNKNTDNSIISKSKNKLNFMVEEKKEKEKKVSTEEEKVEDKKIEKKDTLKKQDEIKKDQEKMVVEDEKNEKKPKKGVFKVILLSIFFTVLFLFLILLGVVYTLKWNQPPIKKVISVLPLPAGFYDYKPISLNSYWEDIDTLNYFYTNQVAQGTYKEVPPESELKNIVWDRLLNMKIIEDLAKKYEVTVTTDDIRAEIDIIVNEAGSREALADNLYEFYKWDIQTFSEKVIGPYLLEDRVWQKISTDPTYDQAAQTEAQQVLTEVKQNPEKFAEIAARVSDDPGSANRGGDLGYFNQGVMVPEFEQAAFNLQVGEISDLVKTQFGYHIIKVDDKTVSTTDENEIQIKASHILISPLSFAEILEKYKQEKKVIRLLDK